MGEITGESRVKLENEKHIKRIFRFRSNNVEKKWNSWKNRFFSLAVFRIFLFLLILSVISLDNLVASSNKTIYNCLCFLKMFYITGDQFWIYSLLIARLSAILALSSLLLWLQLNYFYMCIFFHFLTSLFQTTILSARDCCRRSVRNIINRFCD